MIKAIFFDVDGTLVSFKTHSTLPSTKEAISRLKENGIKCFVATGRSFKAIKEMPVKDIHFDGYLTLTGQLGLSDNGEIIYEIPFDEKMTRAIIDVFYEKKIPLMITEKERVYHNFIDDRVMETFTLLNARDNIAPVDDYHGDHIYQAMTYIRPYSDDTFYKEVFPKKGLRFTSWFNGCVDIFSDNEGKVEGIKRILDLYGIKKEETMAIGDGDNDIDMLKYCKVAVAMGNATDKVKSMADYVAADVDDDGIFKAMQHYDLL